MQDPERTEAAAHRQARQIRNLQALLELSKALAREIRLETLLPVIMQKTTEVLEADRSTLFLYDPDREELWSRVAQGLETQEIRFPTSQGLAGYVARSREVVNIRDAYADPRFNPDVDRRTAYRTESLLCMPIQNSRDELTGVIQVLNKRDRQAFDEEDEALLGALAAHVCVALERAQHIAAYAEQQRVREALALAHEIQQSMLPKELAPDPDRPFDVGARMAPAREVGGDFYDFCRVGEAQLAFAIGDVSGKGVPAALIMAVSRSVLRSLALTGLSPEACLHRANALLYPECPASMFVTALAGRLDLETGGVTYSVGGHLPPFLLPAEGTPYALERTGGLGLCLVPEFQYAARQITLRPGESLFLCTDGLTEATGREGEMFGQERLAACLAEVAGAAPERVIEHVHEAVDCFSAGTPAFDDLTTLVVQYKG